MRPPDVVLLCAKWQPRALIRAQLIEEGFEAIATNTWPLMRRHLRPGSKPRLAIIDVKELPEAREVLQDVGVLMKPSRVLVLTGIATVSREEIERLGFRTMARPIVIGDVVKAAKAMLASADESPPTEPV